MPTSRPLAWFALLVVVPGVLLAVLGWRASRAEEERVEHQYVELLNATADRALAELSASIDRYRDWTRRLPENLPAESLVIRVGGTSTLTVEPTSAVLWLPAAPAGVIADNSWARRAESLEFRGRLDEAEAEYRRLLAAEPGHRSQVLVRLARVLNKAGRTSEALQVYDELSQAPTAADDIPGPLIGRTALCEMSAPPDAPAAGCARDIMADLVSGAWPLSREWYEAYSLRLRQHAGDQSADWSDLLELEARRRTTTEAALSLAAEITARRSSEPAGIAVDSTAHLAGIWQADDGDTLIAIMPAGTLFDDAMSPVLATAAERRLEVSVADPRGATVFATSAGPLPSADDLTGHSSVRNELPGWSVHVAPVDPAAAMASAAQTRRLTSAILALLTLALVAGGGLTARAVALEVRAAREKSRFLAAVSHDFRTPLAGIRQYAEMLASGRVTDDVRRQQYLEKILGASERLSRLVGNVMDSTRIEDGRQTYAFDLIDSATWARALARDFEGSMPAGRALIANIEPDLPPMRADGSALSRAGLNLLDNAVKYSPGTSEVWLDVTRDGGSVLIRVGDRGVGIDDGDRSRVFDRLFRGRRLSEAVGGAGLGLSLVRDVAIAHGGTVACRPSTSGMTVFELRIPAASERAGRRQLAS